jgi:hypothetical protein
MTCQRADFGRCGPPQPAEAPEIANSLCVGRAAVRELSTNQPRWDVS